MFIKVAAIDEYLLKETTINQKWSVHSKYNNSFNLQSEAQNELVVITTTDFPFLPNGIYLEENDFLQVIKSVNQGDSVFLEKDQLRFSGQYLILTQAKKYSSKVTSLGKIEEATLQAVFSYSEGLGQETGVQLSLAEFLGQSNPYMVAIYQACSERMEQQYSGVQFLLGRGKGLTPSGDDMLVGHLAARLLLKQESASIKKLLEKSLLVEELPTTDVSKHYLLCALSGRFSEPMNELLTILTQKGQSEQIEGAIEQVVKFGHTSGIDLLAGFLGTIAYFKGK